MNATTVVQHTYQRGDEVVLALRGVQAHSIERGTVVEAGCLPSWTIGVVAAQRWLDGGPTYVVRIEHDGYVCACTVAESAIEGLA